MPHPKVTPCLSRSSYSTCSCQWARILSKRQQCSGGSWMSHSEWCTDSLPWAPGAFPSARLANPNPHLDTCGFTPKACVRPRGRFSALIVAHDCPSVTSVITTMYLTGRNEFKCVLRLFESWFPICGSTPLSLCTISCCGFQKNTLLICLGARRTRLASLRGNGKRLLPLSLSTSASSYSVCF